MVAIEKRNRDEIEQEYLALLINKSNLIDLVQLQPECFSNLNNRKIFDYITKFYKKYKYISLDSLNPSLLDYYVNLMCNVAYDQSNSISQLEKSEEAIEKFYKEDKTLEFSKKLQANQITYEDYIKALNDLYYSTSLVKNQIITSSELKSNLTISQIGINFKKFPKLSRELKLLQNDLLVIGASTGVGKSGFLLNLLSDLMSEYQCIYFNLEMSKSNIYRRLVAINAKIAINGIDNPSENQKELIDKALVEIENSKISIFHSANTVSDIKKAIMKLKHGKRHTIIFIDHIGLLKSKDKSSLYEETTETIKELRKICLQYGCTIIAASQLNRTAYNSNEITLNMLKDSGELENSSRKIILISYENKNDRENLEPIMNIDIAKNDCGKTGIIKMKYWKISQIFTEQYY